MSRTHILILAAGASSRMAPLDKLTETIDGEPLLHRTVRMALATGATVTVVLPPDRPDREAALAGLDARTVVAEDARLGMSASLRAGLKAVGDSSEAIMILPADMAALTTDDLTQLIAMADLTPGQILRGTAMDGREGHPVVFPATLIPALRAMTGDEGGRSVLKDNRHLVRLVPLPADNALLDLDTPEDWAAFRASRGE